MSDREKFEEWAKSAGMEAGLKRDGESYYSREVHNLWCCWKAAVASIDSQLTAEPPHSNKLAPLPPVQGGRQDRINFEISKFGNSARGYSINKQDFQIFADDRLGLDVTGRAYKELVAYIDAWAARRAAVPDGYAVVPKQSDIMMQQAALHASRALEREKRAATSFATRV